MHFNKKPPTSLFKKVRYLRTLIPSTNKKKEVNSSNPNPSVLPVLNFKFVTLLVQPPSTSTPTGTTTSNEIITKVNNYRHEATESILCAVLVMFSERKGITFDRSFYFFVLCWYCWMNVVIISFYFVEPELLSGWIVEDTVRFFLMTFEFIIAYEWVYQQWGKRERSMTLNNTGINFLPLYIIWNSEIFCFPKTKTIKRCPTSRALFKFLSKIYVQTFYILDWNQYFWPMRICFRIFSINPRTFQEFQNFYQKFQFQN